MSEVLSGRAAAFAAAFAISALIGCASRGTVVLLPEKDGKPTAVVVKQGDKEAVLDKPYAAVHETALGPRPYAATPEEVQTKFGAALASQPQRAASFTLYFVEGKDEFTEDSKRIVEAREQRPFASVDELRRVRGIGVKTLERIRPYSWRYTAT